MPIDVGCRWSMHWWQIGTRLPVNTIWTLWWLLPFTSHNVALQPQSTPWHRETRRLVSWRPLLYASGCAWWRYQMEIFSALLAICAGNSPVTGEFPTQRPVTRSFDIFFDLRLNKRLSKQSWVWWSETPSRLLWRHCNGFRGCLLLQTPVTQRRYKRS